jgi:hypothetical protein
VAKGYGCENFKKQRKIKLQHVTCESPRKNQISLLFVKELWKPVINGQAEPPPTLNCHLLE